MAHGKTSGRVRGETSIQREAVSRQWGHPGRSSKEKVKLTARQEQSVRW